MPYGRYPERVKAFRKWSNDRIDKADINDSVTGSKNGRGLAAQRRRRAARKRRKAKRKEQQNA